MKKTLEMLWQMYCTEYPQNKSAELNEAAKQAYDSEQRLTSALSEKEQELFELCRDKWDRITAISEKQAFIKGVKFATNYLIEASNK